MKQKWLGKWLKIRLVDGAEAGLLLLASEHPSEDGNLFIDEVVLNAFLTKKSTKEIMEELGFEGLTPVHRRMQKGCLFVCPVCREIYVKHEKKHDCGR